MFSKLKQKVSLYKLETSLYKQCGPQTCQRSAEYGIKMFKLTMTGERLSDPNMAPQGLPEDNGHKNKGLHLDYSTLTTDQDCSNASPAARAQTSDKQVPESWLLHFA